MSILSGQMPTARAIPPPLEEPAAKAPRARRAATTSKTFPPDPAAPRAPIVLERVPAMQREVADLKQQVAERVLAATEGSPGALEKLAALVTDIRALEFAIEANGLAHALAMRLDREAVAAWREKVEADPVAATAGITRKKCCGMCSEPYGCVITRGEQCAHPILVGGLGPRRMGDMTAKRLFQAADQHLERKDETA